MKKISATILGVLLCVTMLAGCSKPEMFEGNTYRFTYNSNLWVLSHYEVNSFGLGEATSLLPIDENSFPEQNERINGYDIKIMDPVMSIGEYSILDGAEALDTRFERVAFDENHTYPDFTFGDLTPVAQRQCDVRNGFGENDYKTCYMCAFNTSEGSIVVVCEYDSEKTWREMQKILNTLEIL